MKLIFLFLLLVLPLAAENLTKEQITARIETNKSVTDDPVALEALRIWEEALAEQQTTEKAVTAVAQLQAEIVDLGKAVVFKVPDNPPADVPLADLEALLKQIETFIADNVSQLGKTEDQAKSAPAQKIALIADEEKLRAELQALEIPPLSAGEVETAKHQKAGLTRDRIEARLKEVALRKDLIDKRIKVSGKLLSEGKAYQVELEKFRDQLGVRINSLKGEEAKKTRQVIEEYTQVFETIPELATIVEDLREIREAQDQVEVLLADAEGYDDEVAEVGDRIERQYKGAKERIRLLEEAGLGVDYETGKLFRQQRADLPSVDEISSELREKLELVAKAEISLLEQGERLRNLTVIPEERINELLRENPEITRKAIKELVSRREENLASLVKEYRTFNEELAKGTAAAQSTIDDIQRYSDFIDERLLWIRSAPPFSFSEIPEEWGRLIELLRTEVALLFDGSFWEAVSNRAPELLGILVVVVLIFARRVKLQRVLQKSSEKAVRRNCTTLRPTLQYLGAAILLSLWLPLILYALSALTGDSVAWSLGLFRLANFLFLAALLLKFSSPAGLFVNHFRIHPDRAALVQRNLQWLLMVSPVFVFVVPALTSLDDDPTSGRVAFILGMMVLAAFLHHLFHPKRSILVKGAGTTGFSKSCYVVIILCPIVFIIGAILGYLESVLTLRDQAGGTGALLLLAFLIIRFLTRWTLVSRRRLAITQALRRREIALAERERQEEGDHDTSLPSLEEVKAEAVNVVEVEEQTTKLLKLSVYVAAFFGLWGIWESTLPALSVLDKVELWRSGPPTASESPAPTVIPGVPVAEESGEAETPTTILVDDGRVTLQDLILTIVFFALTMAAARNIPGLLSLTLFNRIKLGPGGNFALTTTVRYLIVLTGVVLALGLIGITWGKVQWLAAAVSLGIGFGLQEIFANFVAGIILLFERPIRLGDIVTVGNISGSVSEIKIRATTIKQFNNRELLVPNKEFITSQLVNWTLNDSILRLEIQVGLAYGSDTDKARGILEKLLQNHPKIMEDPGPSVFFMGFGDSTLDFEARGFVSSAGDLLGTKSELHYQIDQAFREAGLEIAFPQQDIHVRSVPDGVNLTKG